ncbi:MAG: nucleotidyltransferase domain-containing protein [Candidatus Binatia bacterium]
MMSLSLTAHELSLIRRVFRRQREVIEVRLFGSRAKGTHARHSDIDLAVLGDIDELRAESIASELDELPLPYRYDVKPFAKIELQSLREHIERVGKVVYPDNGPSNS